MLARWMAAPVVRVVLERIMNGTERRPLIQANRFRSAGLTALEAPGLVVPRYVSPYN